MLKTKKQHNSISKKLTLPFLETYAQSLKDTNLRLFIYLYYIYVIYIYIYKYIQQTIRSECVVSLPLQCFG